jgi:hypothetical protein
MRSTSTRHNFEPSLGDQDDLASKSHRLALG